MNPHPTLAEIAGAVGVSVMTVSKVLRGQGRISRAMRERVRAEATRLGYHPNPHGVALARTRRADARRGTLALLVGHRDANPLMADPPHPLHYHYPRMLAGVRARAEELGYGLDVFWVFEPGLSARRLESILLARGIAGVVLLSLHPDELALDWRRYVCAYLGRPERAGVAFAFTDFFSATRLAYLKAHAAGYQRIGLVIDAPHDGLTEGRCVGACAATQLVCAGAERVNPLVAKAGGLNAMVLARWLNAERPEAVLFLRNRVPELLAEQGERKIAMADLDLRRTDGTMAGVWLPHDKIGELGVELVHERLLRGERGIKADPPSMGLSGIWHEGATMRG